MHMSLGILNHWVSSREEHSHSNVIEMTIMLKFLAKKNIKKKKSAHDAPGDLMGNPPSTLGWVASLTQTHYPQVNTPHWLSDVMNYFTLYPLSLLRKGHTIEVLANGGERCQL